MQLTSLAFSQCVVRESHLWRSRGHCVGRNYQSPANIATLSHCPSSWKEWTLDISREVGILGERTGLVDSGYVNDIYNPGLERQEYSRIISFRLSETFVR